MASTVRDESMPGPVSTHTRPGVWLTDLSLVFMALIWGVNFSVVKYGTSLVDPRAYNAMRVGLAAITLVIIVAVGRLPLPSRRDCLRLLALGFLGNGIYQFFFVEGIARTSATNTALVVAASPALIALIGRARGVERVSRRGMIGIVLSMVGIGLVVSGSAHGEQRHSSLSGDLFVLAGSLCWAIYTVLLKPYTERVKGFQLSALTMVGGAIPLALAASPALAATNYSGVSALGWSAVVYSGVGSLVVAYYFWYHGVRVLGPTRTAMYSNLQPVIAILVAWLALAETPTLWQSIGAACIMSGLILTRM